MVVVPAYDEAATVQRCLRSLLRQDVVDRVHVVVVANGCRDGTAEVARSLTETAARAGHHLDVLELERADKAAALDAGDRHLPHGPRVYLDADVILGPGALSALQQALADDRALLVAPEQRFIWPRSRLIRDYLVARSHLVGMTRGVTGGGCYAVTAAARQRWGAFAGIHGDDAFVRAHFSLHEQHVLTGTCFLVMPPARVLVMARVARRWRQGNVEVRRISRPHANERHTRLSTRLCSTAPAWRHLVGFLLVELLSRLPWPEQHWYRDNTSRRCR